MIPFVYILLDDADFRDKGLIFHLLNKSEAFHLRCLMPSLMFPFDVPALDPNQPIFSAALKRILSPPLLLKASGNLRPPEDQWVQMLHAPFLIFFAITPPPEWVFDLSNTKSVGLLSPWEEITKEVSQGRNIHVGLLKSFYDLTETYRVIA